MYKVKLSCHSALQITPLTNTMFSQDISFDLGLTSWLQCLFCPEAALESLSTTSPQTIGSVSIQVLSTTDILQSANFSALLCLALVLGLCVGILVLNTIQTKMSKADPGTSGLSMFNILLYGIKPKFLLVQNMCAAGLLISTCIALDHITYTDVSAALSRMWEQQEVGSIANGLLVLALLIPACSLINLAVFHLVLQTSLQNVKDRSNAHRMKALVFTVMCDVLNFAIIACCVLDLVYVCLLM